MICDNCGAIVDRSEEYCLNCGMQIPEIQNYPKKKKHHFNKSRSYKKTRRADKPIKQRYIEKSVPERYDYSQYGGVDEYESSNKVYHENYKRKSDTGLIVILLLIALVLGFTVGLIMFTSQLIPSIPGLNN